jgi:Uma2 family endonuclease
MASAPVIERPELHSGDRMTRAEFHRIYEQMPDHVQAELIGGIVYLSSPLKLPHGANHLPLGSVFFHYESRTPGTQAGDNTTILLGDECEPQPDLFLRLLPEFGGQSRTTPDEYVEGPPELIAEIAHTSRAIDLHAKRDDYARYRVHEYLVVCVREREIRWFDLAQARELRPDPDGIFRVQTFPGLWINSEALFAKDSQRLLETLSLGLKTNEHCDFVTQLAARRIGP